MQSAAMPLCKVQAATLAFAAGASARAGLQALRPQAPSFVKCISPVLHGTRGAAVSALTEAPTPSSPAASSER